MQWINQYVQKRNFKDFKSTKVKVCIICSVNGISKIANPQTIKFVSYQIWNLWNSISWTYDTNFNFADLKSLKFFLVILHLFKRYNKIKTSPVSYFNSIYRFWKKFWHQGQKAHFEMIWPLIGLKLLTGKGYFGVFESSTKWFGKRLIDGVGTGFYFCTGTRHKRHTPVFQHSLRFASNDSDAFFGNLVHDGRLRIIDFPGKASDWFWPFFVDHRIFRHVFFQMNCRFLRFFSSKFQKNKHLFHFVKFYDPPFNRM